MEKHKFKNISVWNILVLILSIVSFVVYAMADAKENSRLILCMLAIAAVAEVILCIKTIPYAEYLPFICALIGMAVFIRLAFDEIGDVLSKINMNGLSTSWIASAILIALTAVVSGMATVFVKERQCD